MPILVPMRNLKIDSDPIVPRPAHRRLLGGGQAEKPMHRRAQGFTRSELEAKALVSITVALCVEPFPPAVILTGPYTLYGGASHAW